MDEFADYNAREVFKMNIKQAETATGITRQNIRFYEAQGLLTPARGAQNAYRDYSDADLHILKTIKMLRKVDVPVPVIKQVLDGTLPLAQAAAQQEEMLRARRSEVDAMLRVCTALHTMSMDTLDVETCLAQIQKEETEGHMLTNIMHDFKTVAASERKKFTFSPDTMIGNAREFTDALLQYAREQDLTLVITKEGMSPEFTLDGQAYTAIRVFTRLGAVVSCSPIWEPDAQNAVAPRRRRWLRALYYTVPIALLFLFFLLRFRTPQDGFGVQLLLAASLTICVAVSGYFFFRNRG